MWSKWFEGRNKMAPELQRCAVVTHTLPGHIEEAVCGNYTIIMSEDMGSFLCPLSAMASCFMSRSDDSAATSAAAATTTQPIPDNDGVTHNIAPSSHSSPSADVGDCGGGYKSAVVCIDWSFPAVCDLLPAALPRGDGTDRAGGSLHAEWNGSRKTCTITRVAGRKITLDTPYLGPAVTKGRPRVYLRTNLTAAATPPPCDVPLGAVLPVSPAGMPGERLASISLSHSATALESHPFLSYVVAGCWDDSITVLSPHSSFTT